MKYLMAVALVAICAAVSYGQLKRVTNVAGVATIANISPEEARQKAIDAAKVEALRLAGVEEFVQSFDFLDRKESNKKYSEFFYSATSVQSMGNVISWKIVDEKKRIDELNNLLYEVHIDADVKIYQTKSDPEFRIAIEGIKGIYKSEENLEFEVTPGKDGFLQIFVLDEQSTVTKLFPNSTEKDNRLAAGAKYRFPLSPHFNYEVFTDRGEEQNYIIFLFSRKAIEVNATSFEPFIQTVYSIEPGERTISMHKIAIVNSRVASDH